MNSGTKHRILRGLAKTGLSVMLALLLLLALLWSLMFFIAHGPSQTMRDLLVGMALQSGAMKFLPYTVMSASTVNSIIEKEADGVTEVFSPTEMESRYVTKIITDENGRPVEVKVLVRDDGSAVIGSGETGQVIDKYDEWEHAVDGIQFITLSRSNFKAYMLIIRDPSRVYMAASCDFKGEVGKRFYEIAEKEDAVAALNGGEFYISKGDGSYPIGLTYSHGKCLWSDEYTWKTFIGFDKDNKLIVTDGMTKAKAEQMGIRDGVTFRTGSNSNRLIYTDVYGNVHVTKSASVAPAQRSAIGQRADGAVILLATDGRSPTSIGADYSDITQLMYEYGAVTAGMLDGGSSCQMFYRDYFDIYNYDKSKLDQYQLMGLVNNYYTGSAPRRVPTYFVVGRSSAGQEG